MNFNFLRSIFRPAVIFPIPAGLAGDKTGMWGLVGLMQNVNNYGQTMQSAATSGTNITLIGSQMLCGHMQVNTGASGGFTITTPSAGDLVAALGGPGPGGTIPLDGTFQKVLNFVNNNVGQTGTMTGGSGVTVVGTATIATDTKRSFVLRILGSSTASLTNVGSLSL